MRIAPVALPFGGKVIGGVLLEHLCAIAVRQMEQATPVRSTELALCIRHRQAVIDTMIGGEDPPVEKVRRSFVDRVLEIAEEPVPRIAFLRHAEKFLETQDFNAAFNFDPRHEPECNVGDDSEQSVTADRQPKQLAVLSAAAAADFAFGIDQGERFHICDDRWHPQTATVDVRRESAAEREAISAGLLLANAPPRSIGTLYGGAVGDQFGPDDASVRNDEAAFGIERVNGRMLPHVDEPGVRRKLLPTHGVASAADRELRTCSACGANNIHECIESGRLQQPRHARWIQLRVNVVNDDAAHGMRGWRTVPIEPMTNVALERPRGPAEPHLRSDVNPTLLTHGDWAMLNNGTPENLNRFPLVPSGRRALPKTHSSEKLAIMIRLALFDLLIAGVFSAAAAESANWPQFRGPQAGGLGPGAAAPTTWNVETGENLRWRTPVPGLAHASPIVWGDRVYVTTAVSPGHPELKVGLYGDIAPANDLGLTQWRLMALNKKTGQLIWDVLGHEAIPRVKRHTKASHCNSTPATDGERIVAIFGSEGLFCFDRAGKLVWKKDLGPMDSGYFQSPTAQWGFASSPVIHEGKVIVLCDVQKDSFLALFELADGKELWRTERNDVPTWGTPTVVKVGQQTQILVNGWRHTGAYDFATGKEIWRLNGGGDIPVPTPIVGRDLGYFTSAHGRARPMRAIRLDATGDITPPQIEATNTAIAWVHPRHGNYMQTPILVGDLLFGCSDNGILACFDARSGEIRYSERLGKGGQGFTASPVSDGRHLYFPSELGQVFVVPATHKFSIAAVNELGETAMASPAVSEGTLFFRTRGTLIAIGATTREETR